jgi:unsaturated chondroitin disaccharide hydrolase
MRIDASGQVLRKCDRVFDFAAAQLRRQIETNPDIFPTYTENGRWKPNPITWTRWTEGFLGGQLWLLFRHNQDPYWREQAEHYSQLIEPRKTDRSVHDLGFLFIPTWKHWYDLVGDPALQSVVIDAGKTLALRYQEKGRYLSSFVAPQSLFIDIMANVGIIFYAAEHSREAGLWQVANQHCLTTRRYLLRGDGSTAHEGIFDLESGQFLRQDTHQGWRADSTWARGLAWALLGFATAYQYSRDPRFLQSAEACAVYYIERTPAHGIPPNDWDEPQPELPYESSAAAITASGLLTLAQLSSDLARRQLFRAYAFQILDSLTDPEFLANETAGWEGLLKHAIYHRSKGLGVDESVAWGDYFFLEALSKALGEGS